tara:strand:+ start:71 stop:577 length:507 start_codon:yes stop_codon:yes gene_type:complete
MSETIQYIQEKLHTAIMEASLEDAQMALQLLQGIEVEVEEEKEALLESEKELDNTGKEKPLPPELEKVVKDEEVIEKAKEFKLSEPDYTVEKGLIELDDAVEKPENELVDKEEKLSDLKDVSAKLMTQGAKGLEVVKEIAVEVERLEVEIQEEIEAPAMKTTGRRRRR